MIEEELPSQGTDGMEYGDSGSQMAQVPELDFENIATLWEIIDRTRVPAIAVAAFQAVYDFVGMVLFEFKNMGMSHYSEYARRFPRE